MQVEIGKKYRIKSYPLNNLPYSWDYNGEMNEYMGMEVMVIAISTNDEVMIAEDKGRWVWLFDDFEPTQQDWDE